MSVYQIEIYVALNRWTNRRTDIAGLTQKPGSGICVYVYMLESYTQNEKPNRSMLRDYKESTDQRETYILT